MLYMLPPRAGPHSLGLGFGVVHVHALTVWARLCGRCSKRHLQVLQGKHGCWAAVKWLPYSQVLGFTVQSKCFLPPSLPHSLSAVWHGIQFKATKPKGSRPSDQRFRGISVRGMRCCERTMGFTQKRERRVLLKIPRCDIDGAGEGK